MEVDGKWDFYDREGKIYKGVDEYAYKVRKALLTIMGGGSVGYGFISSMADDTRTVNILNCSKSVASRMQNCIGWNSKGTPVPTTAGIDTNENAELAHELGHIQYYWMYGDINGDNTNNEYYQEWKGVTEHCVKPVNVSDIWATHIENKIRAELNAPLRNYYTESDDYIGYGKIIKSKRTSVYIDINENIYFEPIKGGIQPYVYKNKCK